MSTLLATCLAVSVAIPRPAVDSDAALLRAIIAVENSPGSNPSQLSEAAKHDNRTPLGHLAYIRRELVAHGFATTPFILALAWNAGVTTVIERRALARHYAFARRCVNLLEVNEQ